MICDSSCGVDKSLSKRGGRRQYMITDWTGTPGEFGPSESWWHVVLDQGQSPGWNELYRTLELSFQWPPDFWISKAKPDR